MTTLTQLQETIEALGLIDLGDAANYLGTEKNFVKLSPCECITSDQRICHVGLSTAKEA
ncbi:MAG TPA: hypothetical protein VHZ51_06735 [Ktedonobacteraceae bacterium]|jgi:hypothetical protein|nr:hypothetical protein [Ktedonobacteraceae bacterium]